MSWVPLWAFPIAGIFGLARLAEAGSHVAYLVAFGVGVPLDVALAYFLRLGRRARAKQAAISKEPNAEVTTFGHPPGDQRD